MVLMLGITVLTDRSDSSKLDECGEILRDYASSVENDNVFARGINVVISNTDIELATDFYKVSGLDEQKVREKAIEYVFEREALYLTAIKNGYSVTDEEVWAYLEELKDIINQADNKDDAMAIISQFNSEQEYWNFEFRVYQKDLSIQNYVADLEKAYMKKVSLQSSENVDDAVIVDKNWQENFEQLKNELVMKEEINIIIE